ncbi:hypothetical protein M231_07829 [Tremella mesenterica]|uniref:Rab-GAP TBC domain-containing protein n=1 Tax=Tremella mesenterica TaxID=5217 RepID=A0A4Q1BBA2_TREME|nr:hypothetical protein M231_07829 [Tremella mesenterica]
MSSSMQDFVELLNAEQYVPITKLRENARHGISSRVRGVSGFFVTSSNLSSLYYRASEVWMYLLEILSSDKTNESKSLVDLNESYQHLSSSLSSSITSVILKTALHHHLRRFSNPTYASLISSLTAEPLPPLDSSPSQPPSIERDRVNANSSTDVTNSPNSNPNSKSPSQILTLSDGLNVPIVAKTDKANVQAQHMRLLPPPPTSPLTRQNYLTVIQEVIGKYYAARSAGLLPSARYTIPNTNLKPQESQTQGCNVEGQVEAGKSSIEWKEEWEDSKTLVYLATPFCCTYTRPIAIYLSLAHFIAKLKSFPPLPSRLASLLTLFRLSIPDLFGYFEDEQVNYIQVAMSWLTGMLGREMCLANVLRLWDAYIASEDMFELHCYVCVAILATCKEILEELDSSEVRIMLLDLPPLDIDRLLQDAANMKMAYPLPRPVEDLK